ncbi:MAG: DUF2235 domain-containing protein [Parcubacteria group bacterium]|nr:DUF2235 domain-containing protein [Parcubacteria group bacterium]
MPKNIVIFSDGTGQKGGKGPSTNIYKLFNIIENSTSRQVSFYDPGLGTNWGQRVAGNVVGAGMSKNILDCYTFISKNFKEGDQIYLFGFSRGAATVRSLSSFIHYFGIIPESRPNLVEKAYEIYEYEDESKRKIEVKKFLSTQHTIRTRIKFLGCYDTVDALGLPDELTDLKTTLVNVFIEMIIKAKARFQKKSLGSIYGLQYKFHDFKLSESVENAYQALAIDDERKTFHPILWDPDVLPHQTIKQVWFCGMHTDVGGGYDEQELSDIPLVWMKKKAVNHGLHINPENSLSINGDVNGYMHNSRNGLVNSSYHKKQRSWDSNRKDKPVVHKSVLQRNKNVNNNDNPPYKPWILDLEYEIEQ